MAAQDMPSGAKGCHWDRDRVRRGAQAQEPERTAPAKGPTLLLAQAHNHWQHAHTEITSRSCGASTTCAARVSSATRRSFPEGVLKEDRRGQSRDATQRQRSAGARERGAAEQVQAVHAPPREVVCAREGEGGGAEGASAVDPEAQNAMRERRPPCTSIEASTTGWAIKHTAQQLGTKNDLIVWLPLRPAQERLYRAFLKSNTVRPAPTRRARPLRINILKKICDHPALCLAITETSAADAAATSHVARSSPSRSPARDGHEWRARRETGGGGDGTSVGSQAARRPANSRRRGSHGIGPRGAPDASGKCVFLMSLIRHWRAAVTGPWCSASRERCSTCWNPPPAPDATTWFASTARFPRTRGTPGWSDSSPRRPSRWRCSPRRWAALGLTPTVADRVVIYDPRGIPRRIQDRWTEHIASARPETSSCTGSSPAAPSRRRCTADSSREGFPRRDPGREPLQVL